MNTIVLIALFLFILVVDLIKWSKAKGREKKVLVFYLACFLISISVGVMDSLGVPVWNMSVNFLKSAKTFFGL